MFHHLDDPHPPVPSQALAQTLHAEGARRRRRRARVVGGATLATVALVLGVAVRPWERDDSHVEVGPSNTSSTQPAPTTTTTTLPTTSTTEAPPAAHTFPVDAFAAITDDGALVLASIETGEVLQTLDQLGEPLGHDIARAPDGSAVYVASTGVELWRYTPDGAKTRIGSAYDVSVSPDGSRLATVVDGLDGQGRIRILEAATGRVIHDLSILELTGNGEMFPSAAEWAGSSDRLLVQAAMPEQGGEIFVVELDGSLRRLGPPAGVPRGTGWYLGGPAGEGEAWVHESCCALDANSYDGGESILRVDTRSGEVLTRDPIDDRWPYVVLDVGPVGSGFLLLAPSTDSNEGGGMLVGAPDGTLEPRAWPAFIEVDW